MDIDIKQNLLGESNPQNNQPPQILTFNQNDYDLDNSLHPTICLLTFAFKGFSFLTYLILASLFLSSTMTFILTTLSSAIDFWIVKNISGRKLVGLRWWRDIDPIKKTEEFRFECDNQRTEFNKVDSTIFWSSQLLSTLGWLILFTLNVLGFNVYWAILTAVQFILSFINLYGYYLCRSGITLHLISSPLHIKHQKQLKEVQSYLTSQGVQRFQQAQGYVLNQAIQQYQKQMIINVANPK